MKKCRTNKIYRIRIITVMLFICFVFGGFFYSRLTEKTFGSDKRKIPEISGAKETELKQKKYSEFRHSQHTQACSSCHKFPSANWQKVRKADEAFPDITEYPKHESCLSCHRQQFFGSAKPVICSICHTNPGPRNSARHPFPNPREIFERSPKGKTAESDFAIFFPHDKHIDIVSRNNNPLEENVGGKALFVKAGFRHRMSEESCTVCHLTYKPQGDSDDEYLTTPPKDLGDAFWLKKGTFKTSPTGHTTCFTCHSDDTGILPAPADCAACHKLKPKEIAVDFDAKIAAPMRIDDKIMLLSWRKRDSSATFRHEFSSHADLECASCHNVNTLNTLEAATKKVNILSCAVCHITATSDDGGILNYEVDARKKDAKFQCVKCHLAYGRLPIPESHFKAIEAQTGN